MFDFRPVLASSITVNNKWTQEEISKRSEYLRSQRDKIIQARQKERSERISKYLIKEKANAPLERPKTARKSEGMVRSDSNESSSNQLAYRKTLAARLKAEVIDKQ